MDSYSNSLGDALSFARLQTSELGERTTLLRHSVGTYCLACTSGTRTHIPQQSRGLSLTLTRKRANSKRFPLDDCARITFRLQQLAVIEASAYPTTYQSDIRFSGCDFLMPTVFISKGKGEHGKPFPCFAVQPKRGGYLYWVGSKPYGNAGLRLTGRILSESPSFPRTYARRIATQRHPWRFRQQPRPQDPHRYPRLPRQAQAHHAPQR